jgi:hypothetical protein
MTHSRSDETVPQPVPAVDGLQYVTTFDWTDRYGEDRQLDIFTDSAESPRVWAYERDARSGGAPVATVSQDGRFAWAPGQPAAVGLGSAAARNDLEAMCLRAHRGADDDADDADTGAETGAETGAATTDEPWGDW